ncbi:N-acetylmuramoyl-L-alanine amidase [Sporosarcina sp. ACRSL]|uniref:N-acetylmuramoyl-L-alanine amidase n=1 Tax=Sporosarcina sp. ACRSL TaxID=2918215 RepID=UPI001EF437E3|nr:N-acetylmuramoyl-L-alanine amidase [Sporosarcina sp. ACRSL]MCG7344289.1 N-acetylmuramoyl-L-alanine amidase [Sporosarcina sp. ACRSL]
MKTIKWAAVALLFFALVSIVPGQSSAQFKFSDISPSKEYYDQVHYIAELGIVNKADKFNPGNNLTRAHAAKMLVIASGKKDMPTPNIHFKDLKPGTEQYEFASRAVDLGYFKKKADGSFGPNEKLKRDEMGYALSVAFNLSENVTVDRPLMLTDMKDHPYVKEINGLYYGGVTRGDAGKFLPNDYLTRSQFALFVARALNDDFKLTVKLPEQTSRTYFAKVATGGDNLNVRSHPAVTGDVVNRLKDGEIVEVIGQTGDWLNVIIDGNYGYIHGQYTVEVGTTTPSDDVATEEPDEPEVTEPESDEPEVTEPEITEPEEEWDTPTETTGLVGKVTAKVLNVRKSPSTSAAITAKLSAGQKVDVISLDGNWAQIRLQSGPGYVHKNYLKLLNQTGNPLKDRVIIIDAGHGGKDPGASKNKLSEKNVVLQVSKLVESKLKKAGAKVLLTRSNDTYLTLEQRTDFAKKHYAEAFVSIHVNAAGSSAAKGAEVFYDSSTNPNASESRQLASKIQANLVKNANMYDRGVKDQRFYVIRNNDVAAVLVELGFITNPDDFKKLSSDQYAEIYAEAIYQGLVQYYAIQ